MELEKPAPSFGEKPGPVLWRVNSFVSTTLWATLVSYFLPLLFHGSMQDAPWLVFLIGCVGFMLAELGNALAADYYEFKRKGTQKGRLLSDWVKPEPLVLKGAWGAYLLAFLCVLIVTQTMGLSGWPLLLIATAGFFTGYYAQAEPFYWDRSIIGAFLSSASCTWIPLLASSKILNYQIKQLITYPILLLFFGIYLWKLKRLKLQAVRYSKEDFPSYAYVSGKTPHPRRDAGGHSFGLPEPISSKTQPEYWRETHLYLYGVDLFNAGYYWEAHEAWESLWKALGPDSDHATFLQGLIQVAAASLKYQANNKEGVVRLSQGAIDKLIKIQKSYAHPYMGVNLKKFVPEVMKTFAIARYTKDQEPLPKFRPIKIVLG